MKKKHIDAEIGFSDAEVDTYTKEGDILSVRVLAWNQSHITVVFKNVIRVLDNDANSISAFCQIIDSSEFLNAALNRLYEDAIPSDHLYVHYQFLDEDDLPALEVVSEHMEISYSGDQVT
ncbi:MAG: hypothetical protein KDH88_08220 [Chromatiales bacterium]|nr:hypothetical protein [Chromatiales bacterium]